MSNRVLEFRRLAANESSIAVNPTRVAPIDPEQPTIPTLNELQMDARRVPGFGQDVTRAVVYPAV